MTLQLEYIGDTRLPIDASPLTAALQNRGPLAAVERTDIYLGNQSIPVAELFRVSGKPSNDHWDFSGDLSSIHHLGANLTRGEIRISGDVGRHTGRQMAGGLIQILGHAGDWLGAEMRGGEITVQADAGDNVGGAYRGEKVGMRGGEILIHGNAGHEVGHSMRRGLIAVAGNVGDFVGFHMRAGTVLIGGDAGRQAGAGMIRGTIAIMGAVAELPVNFRRGGPYDSSILSMLSAELRARQFGIETPQMEIHHGDFFLDGRGELWLRAT